MCGNDGGKWITKEHLTSFSELKIEWLSNKTLTNCSRYMEK